MFALLRSECPLLKLKRLSISTCTCAFCKFVAKYSGAFGQSHIAIYFRPHHSSSSPVL
jgi:hypothetical protein